MNHTPVLLHDHDEFLNEKIFLKGIDVFVDIVSCLADVESNTLWWSVYPAREKLFVTPKKSMIKINISSAK